MPGTFSTTFPLLHHPLGLIAPQQVWQAWPVDAWPGALLAAAATAYVVGLRRTWRAAGVGHGLKVWRAWCFGAGLLALALALLTPIDALGETLFSAHMVQHLLLMAVAPPLLALGTPGVAALRALPTRARRALARRWVAARASRGAWMVATQPLFAAMVHGVAVWAWHLRGPYQKALESEVWHVAEHLSFLLSAMLLWWGIARALRTHRAAELLVGAMAVFLTMLQSGALGALLTFASQPWYPVLGRGAAMWGLTAVQDQQLAGLIMWVPGGAVYLAAIGWLFAAALRERPRAALISEAGRAGGAPLRTAG